MLFATPSLQEPESKVLERIRQAWKTLGFQLRDQPYRWTGFLRRSAFARGIRGSNSIEGYVVSDDDAMAAVEGEEPFAAEPPSWLAVSGYRDAMTYVLRIAGDPHATIDASLIRSLHYMMLSYDLDKRPGAWRVGPIYVRDEEEGKSVYEGPKAALVAELVDELIAWINTADSTSSMVRAAMAHLNLVMIHPFKDGNGRMARCLQTLLLAQAGVYDPVFASVEEFLGRNQRVYYDILSEVGGGRWQPEGDARPWVRFMLTAHFRQATTHLRRLTETGAIWDDVAEILKEKGLPERAEATLVEAAFGHKIRNARYRKHADEVSVKVAGRDLKALVDAGLLTPHGERRGRWYERSELLLEIRNGHRYKTKIPDPFALVS